MFRFYSALAVFVCFTILISAQSGLYIPKEVSHALIAGTRTVSGVPGDNYWQNYADYKINARVVPDSSLLKGQADITYYNNSPDSLGEIVLRLYQNISKRGSIRDWYLDTVNETGGIKVSNLFVNGNEVDLDYKDRNVIFTSTNMIIKLKQFLKADESINIRLDWEFKISEVSKIRMGNYGEGDMFISYWYPQVAVYDDIEGWDMLEYTGVVEFYNDFNNYDFEITLPGKYIVWATGELQNPEEIFTPEIIGRINNAKLSDETVNIISQADYPANEILLLNEFNTWRFGAKNVSDVSFCLSDNYLWDAASVEVEPGRRVLTNAVYPEGTINFDLAAAYSRATIDYLSTEIPGIPYPYPHVTTFCNKNKSGGMETPMMANNGAPVVVGRSVGLIFHEIAHTYFPFIMGINERKYAFMDEGWASFLPNKIVAEFDPKFDAYALRVSSYESNAGKEGELPPMVLSYSNKSQYRTAAYDRPAVAYNELYDLIGDEPFKSAIRNYINSWQGKHPLPSDFFNSFNKSAGENLNWFWKPWFYEFGYPDLSIDSVLTDGNSTDVVIKKIGCLPVQISLTFELSDESKETISASARVWSSGSEKVTLKFETGKKIRRIVLGNNHIPDINKGNNVYVIKENRS